jgi:hypothetical protein
VKIGLGLGLYNGAPAAAFVVEMLYGVLCWWVYRGSKALLSVIVLGNLANVSFFFAGLAGPEQVLVGVRCSSSPLSLRKS